MKKTFLLILCFLVVQPAFANGVDEKLHEKELLLDSNDKIKIKDIKTYLLSINPDSTCMDEYLARRKQLIVKLGLAPVTLAVGGIASVYIGVGVGAGAAYVAGAQGSWTALGFVLGGAMAGPVITTAAVTADTASGIIQLMGNDLIMKSIAESHLDRSGGKMDALYEKVTKKMTSKPTREEFAEKLLAMDASGELCDGSLVEQPRFKLGLKLKYKVARIKNIKIALAR